MGLYPGPSLALADGHRRLGFDRRDLGHHWVLHLRRQLHRCAFHELRAHGPNSLPASGRPGAVAGGKGTSGTTSTSSEVYGFATARTDVADCPPGTTVNISGSGWQAGESGMLMLVESPFRDDHTPYYHCRRRGQAPLRQLIHNPLSRHKHQVHAHLRRLQPIASLRAICFLRGFRFLRANVLGKVPLMAFRIRRPITPMAVLRVGWLLEDDGTSFARALTMFVDALYINVQALRGLA